VTLQFSGGLEHGLVGRLPEPVRGRICPDGSLALCVPAHDATWQVLRRVPIPVVLTTLAGDGSGPPMTAAAAAQAVGDRVRLVVDGGPARDARPATVVRIDDNHWSVMRDGAVSAAELAQQTTCVIIFVCTGNTCRSPMAEALCTKLLTERLGCAANELPQRGFLVLSAGVSAMPGDSAAPEAIDVMQELGADLEGHCSRPLTAQLVGQADYLLTMTHGHQAMVRDRFGRRGPRPRLLCPEGRDVADPIGQHREVYRDCAQQILQHLERLLPELQQP
jgi:protein-tyrosine phosphatase